MIGTSLGIAWFAIFLVAQLALFRVVTVTQRFTVIAWLLVVAMAGCLTSTVLLGVLSPLSVLAGVCVMACLWVLYMPFYYVVANSISVRILIALDRAGGAVEVKELEARFASLEILRERLETMAAYGNLRPQGSAFQLSARGRTTARAFSALKRLWGLGAGG